MGLKEEILKLHELKENWDGEGAERIDPHSLYEALHFAEKLSKGSPTLFGIPISEDMFEARAQADGTCAVLHNEKDLFIGLVFLKDRKISYFIKREGHTLKGIM